MVGWVIHNNLSTYLHPSCQLNFQDGMVHNVVQGPEIRLDHKHRDNASCPHFVATNNAYLQGET